MTDSTRKSKDGKPVVVVASSDAARKPRRHEDEDTREIVTAPEAVASKDSPLKAPREPTMDIVEGDLEVLADEAELKGDPTRDIKIDSVPRGEAKSAPPPPPPAAGGGDTWDPSDLGPAAGSVDYHPSHFDDVEPDEPTSLVGRVRAAIRRLFGLPPF